MKGITTTVKGISALLMHAFPLEPVEAIEKKSKEEQAEISAYRDPDTKELYVPALAIQRGLVAAATFSKGRGRASLKKEVAAGVFVSPERVGLGTKDYVIDSRPVVISATRGRIIRHRPRLDGWSLTFEIEYDEALLTESQLRRVVDDLGARVGILDYRPEKLGPFGRFMVTDWA